MDENNPFLASFIHDVREGLGNCQPKQLPAKYLYDSLGSALFDAITFVPEYGLTRAEKRIIQRSSKHLSELFSTEQVIVAELGSGVTRKLASYWKHFHQVAYSFTSPSTFY